MLCAGSFDARGPCFGDEGGALVINGMQYGIVSWIRGCGFHGYPAVYTRIPYFTNWIRSVS